MFIKSPLMTPAGVVPTLFADTPRPTSVDSMGIGPGDPTIYARSSGGDSFGTGTRIPLAQGFPSVLSSSAAPPSSIVDELATLSPETPVSVTAIKNPNATATGASLSSGHIIVVGDGHEHIDITGLPVDIAIVPQWRADKDHGGGATGGIAYAWKNRVEALRHSGQMDEAGKLSQAVEVYEAERDQQPLHAFDIGTCLVADTKIKGKMGVAPAYLLHVASVPPNHLKYANDTATQQDRVIFVSKIIRNVLERIRDSIVAHDSSLTAKDRTVRIAFPMISTGPDGALTLEECAAIMLTEIGKFCEENPGYEFVIPLYSAYKGDWRKSEQLERFSRIMQGDAKALEEADIIRPRTPRQMLDELFAPFQRPIASGVRFTREYFDTEFDRWSSAFSDRLSGDVSSAKAVADRFTTTAQQLLVSSLFYHASLEGGKVTQEGFLPPRITSATLRKILTNKKFRDRVYTAILGTLYKFQVLRGFGGGEKMDDIIAASFSDVLEELSIELYSRHWVEFTKQVRSQNKEIKRLSAEKEATEEERAKFEAEAETARTELAAKQSQLTAKQRSLDLLKRSLTEQAATASAEVATAQREADEAAEGLREKEREVRAKDAEIRKLQRKVEDLNDQVSGLSSRASSSARAASSFSSSFSRGA